MKKRLVVYFLLAVLSASVYGQGKGIEVRVGNSIWHGDPKIAVHVIRITTGADGIIQSIKEVLPSGDVDLATIKRRADGSVVVTTPSYDPCTIKVQDSELFLSGPYLVTTGQTNPLRVAISPAKNVIYDSRVSELKELGETTLVEKLKDIPNNNIGFRLYGGTLYVDYKFTNNVDSKYVFVEKHNVIYVTYFYHMGLGLSDDDFDEYSPPIEVRGPRLFSPDTTVNVINHFVLLATNEILAAVLFPGNFLRK